MNLLPASITDVTDVKAMPHVAIRTRIEGTASVCSTEMHATSSARPNAPLARLHRQLT